MQSTKRDLIATFTVPGEPAMQPMQARWAVTARRWRSVLTVIGPDHRAGTKSSTPHVVIEITDLGGTE